MRHLRDPDDRDEAARRSSAGLGRPRHPHAGGRRSDTTGGPYGLHELTYGTEPMAAEADPYLIQAVRLAVGPGRWADTMSSHETTALDADQEERSADVVTGGRHAPAELVLSRLEARMAESGLRAHIYLAENAAWSSSRRARKRTDRPLERNVGAALVRRRSRGATASRDRTPELAHALARRRGGTDSSAGADAVEHPGPRGPSR